MKLTVAGTDSGGSDGGAGVPRRGVGPETLLPEDLFGGRTPNLDLATVPRSTSTFSKGKGRLKPSSPASFPLPHRLCSVNLLTPRCPFMVCAFYRAVLWLGKGSLLPDRQMYGVRREQVEKVGMVTPRLSTEVVVFVNIYGNSHLSPIPPSLKIQKRTIFKQ